MQLHDKANNRVGKAVSFTYTPLPIARYLELLATVNR